MFMLPVPSWVHPAWMICAGLLSLVVARKVVGLRWTATIIAATYLAYRAVMWLGLVAMGFPPSVLPLVLIVGAVLVDVAVTRRVPGWLAGPLVTGRRLRGRPSGRRRSACCRPGTGGRSCRWRIGFGRALDRGRPAPPQPLVGPLADRRCARRRGGSPRTSDPGARRGAAHRAFAG